MKSLSSRIESLDTKFRQVLQKMELIKKENKSLLEENITLKKEKDKYLSAGVNLTPQSEVMQSSENVFDLQENENLSRVRDELDQYVSEIDECISLLKEK